MPCRKRSSSSRATIIAANNYYAQSAQTPSALITTCEGMKKTIWPLRMKMSMTLHAGISFPLGNIKVNDDDGHPLSNFNQRLVSPSLTVHCFTYANQIERIKTPLQGKRKRKGVLLKLILINMKGLFALIEETNTDHCPTLLHLSFPFGISVAICVGKCLDTSSEKGALVRFGQLLLREWISKAKPNLPSEIGKDTWRGPSADPRAPS